MDRIEVANRALAYLEQPPLTLAEGQGWDAIDPKNKPHSYVRIHYDGCRREVLSRRAWSFATVKQGLVPSDYVSPEARWNVVFQYPENCLKFIDLVDVLTGVGTNGLVYYPSGLQQGESFTFENLGSGLARPGTQALIQPDGSGLSEISTEAFDWIRRFEVSAYLDDTGQMRKVILSNFPESVGMYVVDVPDLSLWSVQALTALSFLLASRVGASLGKTPLANRTYALYRSEIQAAEAHDANESNNRPRQEATWTRARRRF